MDLRRLTPSSLGAAILVAALLAVNSLATWGIVAARRDARRAAVRDLELRTLAQARSLEATLASLRADLVFLSRSPPLAALLDEGRTRDPMVRRWSRLDAEGTILLFLEAHPAIEHLVLYAEDAPILRAGRQNGAPLLLPRSAAAGPSPDWVVGRWPMAASGGANLEAWLAPSALLPPVDSPLARSALVLDGSSTSSLPDAAAPAAAARGSLVASVAVSDDGWDPPLLWRLVRAEEEGDLARSIEALAGRFGATVALNVAVMATSLILGAVTLRNLRRTARLEAEREQQARVRELERQVLHTERLASVGRLAAGFAHEINNPLEGIANYLALLRDELAAGKPHEASALIDRATEGVNRAAGVIRQILAFSESGSPIKETIDLREVVDRTAAFVGSNPRYRGADLHLSLGEVPLLVVGNAVTLGQLMLNLLLNALQAGPSAGPVEVHVAAGGGELVVEVRDRGPGVPSAVRDTLFEPFTSTRGSIGLGLAVCRDIVEDHGGRIAARDRDGGGAVFVVNLPAASSAAVLHPALLEESRG